MVDYCIKMSEMGKGKGLGGIPPKKMYTYAMKQKKMNSEVIEDSDDLGSLADSPGTSSSITSRKDSGIGSACSSDVEYSLRDSNYMRHPTTSGAHGKVMPNDYNFGYSPSVSSLGDGDRTSLDGNDLSEMRNRSSSISLPPQKNYPYRSPNMPTVRTAYKNMTSEGFLSEDDDNNYKIKRSSNSFSGVRSPPSHGYRYSNHSPYRNESDSDYYIDSYGQPMFNRRMSNDMISKSPNIHTDPTSMNPISVQCPDSTISPNMPLTPQKMKSPGKDVYFDQQLRYNPNVHMLQSQDIRLNELSDQDTKNMFAFMPQMKSKRTNSRTGSMENVTSSISPAKKEEVHACQVCGDNAAGFHCGAFVCEACKKFFVRSKKPGVSEKFSCSRSRQCIITKETRTQCQFCRFEKCISLGMYKPGCGPGGQSMNADISNIPCKVCGAKSSGYHFGAITCEGCKGFFRRTVRERDGVRYTCSKLNQCEITTENRNVCKACRYQKCLTIGMTPEGSRIGRQPNAVKHATMLELQQIQARKNLKKDEEMANMAGNTSMTHAPGLMQTAATTVPPAHPLITEVKAEPLSDGEEEKSCQMYSGKSFSHIQDHISKNDIPIDEDLQIPSVPSLTDAALECELSPRNILDAINLQVDDLSQSSFVNNPPPYVPSEAEKKAVSLEDVKGKVIQDMYFQDDDNVQDMVHECRPVDNDNANKTPPYEIPKFTDAQISLPLKQLYGQVLQMDRPHPYMMPGKFVPNMGKSSSGPMRGLNPHDMAHMPPGRMPMDSEGSMLPPDISGFPGDIPTNVSGGRHSMLPGMSPFMDTSFGLAPSIGKLSVSDDRPMSPTEEQRSNPKTATDGPPPPPTPPEPEQIDRKVDLHATAEAILAAVKELEDVRKRPEGIIINDDQPVDSIWRDLMKTFIGCAIPVLKFCKKIPGFRKVDMNKRIGLIQGSMYPLVLLVYSFDYDVDCDNYSYFKFTMEEQKCIQRKFPSMNMIEKHLWSLGRSMKTLNLDKLEMGLLAALFIYRDIEDEDIREELLATLEAHCISKCGENTVRASVILTKLSELQRANLQHQQMIIEVMSTQPDLEITQLYEEVFLNDP